MATKEKTIKWEPDNFELETNTVWAFPERGKWATHDAKWRGNWSPYIPRNIILRYSKEGDLLLDQFAGGGTTLVEAKLLNRNIIGVDVNPIAIDRCVEKCAFERDNAGKVDIKLGDARSLDFIESETVDLICTHPPYANIIRYSEEIENDLSRLEIKDFLRLFTREEKIARQQKEYCHARGEQHIYDITKIEYQPPGPLRSLARPLGHQIEQIGVQHHNPDNQRGAQAGYCLRLFRAAVHLFTVILYELQQTLNSLLLGNILLDTLLATIEAHLSAGSAHVTIVCIGHFSGAIHYTAHHSDLKTFKMRCCRLYSGESTL